MKRILALDGGGIRGLFSLQVLARIEKLLREEKQQPNLVLADEFDLFAGTSTGAIIAAGLCWGMSVVEIEKLYLDHGKQMFTRSPWFRRLKAKYRCEKLADLFRNIFYESDPDEPALLSTQKLRKLLLVVMRNASTGAPWPITNNPRAKFNDRALTNCNLDIPLWQLIRASTAAPTFFAPERIVIGSEPFLFVDGAITPFNNPTLIAVLSATLPCYHVDWPASREDLHVVSIGTGTTRARLRKLLPQQVNLIDHLLYVPTALVGASSILQDAMCRVMGDCRYGAPIDLEIGNLCEPTLFAPSEQKFTYVRYDTRLDLCKEMSRLPSRLQGSIDNLKLIPTLQQAGRNYAEEHVQLAHLYPRNAAVASR